MRDCLALGPMWFCCGMLRINGWEKRTNKNAIKELGLQMELVKEISKKKFKDVGHLIRHSQTNLMTIVLYGKKQ